MELVVRIKTSLPYRGGGHFKCLPGFINLFSNGKFLVKEGGVEVHRDMEDYDVYIKPYDTWLDLEYAYAEGFLDPQELRRWP